MSSRAPRPSWTQLPPLPDPPPTLLDWLETRFPRVGRRVWEERLRRGLVTTAAGRVLGPGEPYEAGLRLRYFREVESEALGGPAEIDVVAVDEHLVVADKPPFLAVVPGGRFVRDCLLYRLEEQLGLRDLAPVHRLDRATSGLVLFARRPDERGAYAGLFAAGAVERTYLALASVPERPQQTRWTVRSRLGEGEPFFRVAERDDGVEAATTVELLSWRAGIGRFELRPATGRKHQLRVHMASLGWPIVGDRLYPLLLPEGDDPLDPLRLVAWRLAFRDPVTGEPRELRSALDPDRLGG